MTNKVSRIRRAQRGRSTIKRLEAIRLSVFRSRQHIYAQIIAANGATVMTSASSLDKEIKGTLKSGGNINAAMEVGKQIALRALKIGIKKIAFDRSGYKYHGRVKALADAARESGLDF